MNWRLVIGEENETYGDALHHYLYKPGDIVYLSNHTLQIYHTHADRLDVYEVDMDRQGRGIEWLSHLAEKPWATCEMIKAVASAARRICTMTRNWNPSLWSVGFADEACERIENRDN